MQESTYSDTVVDSVVKVLVFLRDSLTLQVSVIFQEYARIYLQSFHGEVSETASHKRRDTDAVG